MLSDGGWAIFSMVCPPALAGRAAATAKAATPRSAARRSSTTSASSEDAERDIGAASVPTETPFIDTAPRRRGVGRGFGGGGSSGGASNVSDGCRGERPSLRTYRTEVAPNQTGVAGRPHRVTCAAWQ